MDIRVRPDSHVVRYEIRDTVGDDYLVGRGDRVVGGDRIMGIGTRLKTS